MSRVIFISLLFHTVQSYSQVFPSQEVTFANGEIELSGTLSFPVGEGPFPALLLIAGSGSQDRDSNLMGFKIFEIMANHFNENGVAVLRYDERGVGKSIGPKVMMSTTQDLANDASAAIKFLLEQDGVNNNAIGILGHSEGGVIAPKVAVANTAVDFIILLAGYGVPGIQVSELQVRKALESDTTLTQEYIDIAVANNTRLIKYGLDESLTDEERLKFAIELTDNTIDYMSERQQSGIANREVFVNTQAKNALKQIKIPWLRYYLQYDPRPTLRQVKIPTLLLFGEKDQQVTVEQNKDVMLQALKEGGNEDVTVKVFKGANHLFQKATTGSPREYFALERNFIPELLPFISNWVNRISEQTNPD